MLETAFRDRALYHSIPFRPFEFNVLQQYDFPIILALRLTKDRRVRDRCREGDTVVAKLEIIIANNCESRNIYLVVACVRLGRGKVFQSKV